MSRLKKIDTQNATISITSIHEEDYVCITNMVRAKRRSNRADDLIKNRIRNRTTIEFWGTLVEIYNPVLIIPNLM